MNDSISRQAALTALNGLTEIYLNNLPPTIYKSDAVDAIKALSSAQPVEDIHREKEQAYYCGYEDGAKAARSAQPGWIPISEKLPKDDTEVIVSCTDDSGDYEYSYVTTGWHYKGLWVVNNDRCYFVKAWQPLPAKPWEGGRE